jgi:phosphate transport system substrate-binding protein
MSSFLKYSLLTLSIIGVSAETSFARDQIRIVGSSTVFPYTVAVAEEFSNQTGAPSPIVEATGTGGGFQIFCAGIGTAYPDITGASRSMKKSEFELCQTNGVTDISEALIGNDGLSISMSRSNTFDWNVTLEEVYLALAAFVPINGKWVTNPYQTWSEINPGLPSTPIRVYGPPPTSGTRDAFVELAMHVGCSRLDFVKQNGHDLKWITENCSRMRVDGPFIEAGENDNLIVQQLRNDVNAMGIFGYSFLYENEDVLKGVKLDGVLPSLETITSYEYPVSRPLYFYVKNTHRGTIPNLQEFLEEYVSDYAIALDGYLTERGLVPLPEDQLLQVQESVINAVPMKPPAR